MDCAFEVNGKVPGVVLVLPTGFRLPISVHSCFGSLQHVIMIFRL